MIIKKIKIPIYFGTLIIVQSNDFKEVEEKFDLTETKYFDAFVFRRFNKKDISEYYLFIKNDVSNSIVSHECVHLTNLFFLDNNIQLDLINDEPQAYLHGWFFEQIEKFINNNK